MKDAILGLYISNLISSNSLRPFLTNLRIFTILSLTATLTQYETSVPRGGGRGVQKMAIWGDFQGLIGVTGGGRGVKKLENWGDVIYGWSLR